MDQTLSYGFTRVRDLRVRQARRTASGKLDIQVMEVDGEPVLPSKRFWTSFCMRFAIAESVFRYFEPCEVFQRISQRAAEAPIRYCLERAEAKQPRLLAVSNPDRPIIRHSELQQLLANYGGRELRYADGTVTSTHIPRSGEQTFCIRGDQFQHRFRLETPVDGFGHPKVFLALLRLVCTNGMVGYTPTFRSEISLGKDLAHCIGRALDSFDNGEGYAALRQRFDSSQTSWASVRECLQLYKVLTRLNDSKELRTDQIVRDFYRMTGNLNELYGVANLDAISTKRQRVLPARCRVYDLLNFASEVATHRASTMGDRTLQGYVGTLLSDEFDMEGTAETVTEFSDFFLEADEVGPPPSRN
jgi:hypothetical protein